MKLTLPFALLLSLVSLSDTYGQCNTGTQFPATSIDVSNYNDTFNISSGQFAGEYAQIIEYASSETYTFFTDEPRYLTITDEANNNVILAQGESPVTFNPSVESFRVYANLVSPPCGTNATSHQLFSVCTTCPDAAQVTVGNVLSNTNSAAFAVNSTTQGVLFPRLLASTISDIPDPVDGLMVYDRDARTLVIYRESSGEWARVLTSGGVAKTLIISSHDFDNMRQENGDASVEKFISSTFGTYGDFSGQNAAKFSTGIQLPVGSEITGITYYYYDNNATLNMKFEVYGESVTSSFRTMLASYTSSGRSLNKKGQSRNVDITIQEGRHYYIEAYGGTTSNVSYDDLGIGGIRIDYR